MKTYKKDGWNLKKHRYYHTQMPENAFIHLLYVL